MTCHRHEQMFRNFLAGTGSCYGSLAPGPVTAAVTCILSRPRRIRSSRNRQISSGTCIPHGGWLFQPGAGAVRRMHRCAVSHHQFQVYRWMVAVRLLAFVHQSYDCCTIITHMRINHLKDRIIHTISKKRWELRILRSCAFFLFVFFPSASGVNGDYAIS